jgi:hypothetical protein
VKREGGLKMSEDLERIEQGLVYGAKLDAYDRDLIIRIINEQQKRIRQYETALNTIANEEYPQVMTEHSAKQFLVETARKALGILVQKQ